MKTNINNNKYAIVTGASKGLGYAYCEALLKLGYNIIGVARNTNALNTLKEKYSPKIVKTYDLDLSDIKNIYFLFEEVKNENVEILINNAGFGVWGYFQDTNLVRELNMIDLNIKAVHILTKLFLTKFQDANRGWILNISSILAPFSPAPVFSSYYASKAYVHSLSVAINVELKKTKSKVRVISICPGLLKTDFWKRSSDNENAKYNTKSKTISLEKFAKTSLKRALKTKRNYVIVGLKNHMAKFGAKYVNENIILNQIYNFQRKR